MQRTLKECCGQHWGEAASKELRTYVPTIRKMVFSDYTKRRILQLRRWGNRALDILRLLRSEGISAIWRGISKFLLKHKVAQLLYRRHVHGLSSLHDTQVLPFIAFRSKPSLETCSQESSNKLHRSYARTIAAITRGPDKKNYLLLWKHVKAASGIEWRGQFN